jgi:ribonuclease R
MEVEREIVDLYRAVLMRDRIGERYEGTVTALVGSGLFVQLDSPFVDVLVRLEDLGGDRWELDDEKMRVSAARSGESISAWAIASSSRWSTQILRRTVYGKSKGSKGGPAPKARPMSRADQLKLLRAGRKSKKTTGGGPPGRKKGPAHKK